MCIPNKARSALGALFVASSALALGAGAARAAAEPPPAVEVTQASGSSGLVEAQLDIAAPPQTVWRVLVDCPNAPKLMVNLKSCRIIDHDPAGHWDVREQISRASFLPSVRTVIRADYDPYHTVRFHKVDGDLKQLDGEWRLEPIDGGAHTHLTYESRVTASFIAPGPIVRAILRHDMPLTLANLRKACEQQAALAQQP